MTSALSGKRVLITRAGEQAAQFARALADRDAEPVLAPAIAIVAPDDPSEAERAVAELPTFDWLIFTSQNGVDAFAALLEAQRVASTGAAKIAAIGERTAERLRARGIRVDATAREFVAEALARELVARATPGQRALLFTAQEARDVLPAMLEAAGLRVTVAAAYKTVVPEDPHFAQKVAGADVLTFASASAVRGYATLLGSAASDAARGKCIACIGPITAAAAAESGLAVDVVAATHTGKGLIDALESFFRASA